MTTKHKPVTDPEELVHLPIKLKTRTKWREELRGGETWDHLFQRVYDAWQLIDPEVKRQYK